MRERKINCKVGGIQSLSLETSRMLLQDDTGGRAPGWGDLNFDVHRLPDSAGANGSLAKPAGQLGKRL